jgi:hypothetical protein
MAVDGRSTHARRGVAVHGVGGVHQVMREDRHRGGDVAALVSVPAAGLTDLPR